MVVGMKNDQALGKDCGLDGLFLRLNCSLTLSQTNVCDFLTSILVGLGVEGLVEFVSSSV
jgi:hypothetical protein